MIYWKNRIVSNVEKALEGKCSYVVSTVSGIPKQLPCVAVVVVNNASMATDLENNECAVRCSVRVQAYSSKSENECIELLSIADSAMWRMGFQRFGGPTPNGEENGVRAVAANYSRVIGDGNEIEKFGD